MPDVVLVIRELATMGERRKCCNSASHARTCDTSWESARAGSEYLKLHNGLITNAQSLSPDFIEPIPVLPLPYPDQQLHNTVTSEFVAFCKIPECREGVRIVHEDL